MHHTSIYEIGIAKYEQQSTLDTEPMKARDILHQGRNHFRFLKLADKDLEKERIFKMCLVDFFFFFEN